MPELADKRRLQRTLDIVLAAAAWEREAGLLSADAYAALTRGLQALRVAVDRLTPELPDDFQP